MATQTGTVSGTQKTYVITDVEGNTVTVIADLNSNGGCNPWQGIQVNTSGTTGVLADAAAMLVNLLLLLYTGLAP